MIDNILKNLVNKKDDQLLYTGIVHSLNPLEVKFYPDDNPILVATIATNITINSNVIMVKYLSKFIIIGVLGEPNTYTKLVTKSDNQNITGTNMTDITDISFTLKANCTYSIDLHMNCRIPGSSSVGGKFNWDTSHEDYYLFCGRNMRGGEAQANNSTTLTLCRNSGGHNLNTEVSFPFNGTSVSSNIEEHFVIQVGEDDILLQYKAGQITNNTTYPLVISRYTHAIINKFDNVV